MRTTILLLTLAVGAAGCRAPIDPQIAILAKAKQAVAAKLLDPTSPLFTEVTVRGEHVCGLVNAKNVYGAYTGGKRFTTAYGSATLEPDPPSKLLRQEPGQTVPCMFDHEYQSCKTGVENNGITECFAWAHDDVDHTPGTPMVTKASAAAACLEALDKKFDTDIRRGNLTALSSRSSMNDRGTWSVEMRYNAADNAEDSGIDSKGRCEVNANGVARVAALVME